jgi:hypothetical protein
MKLGPSPDTFTARDSLQSHEEALDRSALMRGLITPEMVFGVLSLPWAFIVIVTTVPQAKKPVFAECLGVMPAHECCGCGVQGLSP